MTTFQAALVKEQGVTFAVVVVRSEVLDSTTVSQNTQRAFQRYFPNTPIILMRQDFRGVPTYYGRRDIVAFLSKIHFSQLPWREYTIK